MRLSAQRWRTVPGARPGGPRSEGFVLIGILLLLMLVSMTAISLLFRVKADATAGVAAASSEQAMAAAMSGVQEAMRIAARATPGTLEWRDNARAFRNRFVAEDGADRWYFTVYSAADEDGLGELRYGLTDEASRLNVNVADAATLARLPGLPQDTLDALARLAGGDGSVTNEAAATYAGAGAVTVPGARKAVYAVFDELLRLRGFTPSLLYGEDANMNFRLDPNEDDALERWPPDNRDGRLDLGLRRHLGVFSTEPNRDARGARRTNVNDPRDPLPPGLPETVTHYVAALRSNRILLGHPAELLEARATMKDGAGREVEMGSGVGKDELAVVLDRLTAIPGPHVEGLVNVNTASIAVLQCVPGIDLTLAESIAAARQGIGPEQRASLAWLFTEGVMDAARFKSVARHLTTRSFQYSFHVLGFGWPSGRFRVLDVTVDLGGGAPAILWMRDQTRLGLPFRLESPTFEGGQGGASLQSPASGDVSRGAHGPDAASRRGRHRSLHRGPGLPLGAIHRMLNQGCYA